MVGGLKDGQGSTSEENWEGSRGANVLGELVMAKKEPC